MSEVLPSYKTESNLDLTTKRVYKYRITHGLKNKAMHITTRLIDAGVGESLNNISLINLRWKNI